MSTKTVSAVSYLNFQMALASVSKSVSVQIADEDFDNLKLNNYKLCFAKKVGEEFNVVWESYDKEQYLQNNDFSWTPQYELFGSNTFVSNIQVHVSTKRQSAGLGETCVLDKNGKLGPATTGGPATCLTLKNDFGMIHSGVCQVKVGLDGAHVSNPIYVSPFAITQGEAHLTPKESVLVWFEQNIETGTMFSDARSNPIEVNMTDCNSAAVKYGNGVWSRI